MENDYGHLCKEDGTLIFDSRCTACVMDLYMALGFSTEYALEVVGDVE